MLSLILFAVVALSVVAILARLAVAGLLSVPGVAAMRIDRPYFEAPRWKRGLVRAAGPVAAYAATAILFAALGARPQQAPTTTVDPVPGSPAALAGVQSGDEVVAVAGHPVTTWHELQDEVRSASPGAMTLTVRRAGATTQLRVTPDASGRIGVRAHVIAHTATPSAVLDTALFGPWRAAGDVVGDVFRVVSSLFRGHAPPKVETLAGPVAVVTGRRGPDLLGLACRGAGPALPIAILVDLVGFSLLIRYAPGSHGRSRAG